MPPPLDTHRISSINLRRPYAVIFSVGLFRHTRELHYNPVTRDVPPIITSNPHVVRTIRDLTHLPSRFGRARRAAAEKFCILNTNKICTTLIQPGSPSSSFYPAVTIRDILLVFSIQNFAAIHIIAITSTTILYVTSRYLPVV